jgi:hypothetical protein
MMTFEVKDVITIVLASLGAVLGVLNTWRAYDKDRPKIRVSPRKVIPVGPTVDPRARLAIEVTNLSWFPLTVSEVGVLFRGTSERGVVIDLVLNDGGSFPRRLESRASFMAYLHPEAFASAQHRVRAAYAKTDCGLTFTGNSPALQQLCGGRS